ncbi:discoidin domain-containing protein [Arachidicoccus soli]|uniref:Discoidin domain-containing protein n=1 Tax=Arachidicoccus soli TaxID=2341117 RepID=A0A386HN65_9BACT|nr:discoidin domain-containing protein [Arachidicoccus soli]AYD46960.1 discoidin domain-containing protein [Arachidicoccus soli]
MKIFFCFLITCFLSNFSSCLIAQTSIVKTLPAEVIIDYGEGKPANSFIPNQSLGFGIDGHEKGDNATMLSAANIIAVQTIGLHNLSYRLRTELGMEAWHWNPEGHWSDEKDHQGYWVSDTNSTKPIELSWGYFLPRRGNTFDQAENNSYSRIDDGEEKTFWKSNPYLDAYFTGVPDSIHPQWIAVDLGKEKLINQIVIHWAAPYATDIRLEYANDSAVSDFNGVTILDPYKESIWKPLPIVYRYLIKGGKSVIHLPKIIHARVVRIDFLKSSHTALPGSKDRRDSCGFAIREIEVGILKNGLFKNYVIKGKTNKTQSTVFVSTTDLWHRSTDKDVNTEQPGIDFIYKSGLARKNPALLAAGLVYDIPENTLALVKYLHRKHYPILGLELGEEPDGQYISPQDFAELYLQSAKKIKQEFPHMTLGGPSFQGLDFEYLDDPKVDSWQAKLYNQLKKRNGLSFFQFMSFEWYPLDDICAPAPPQVIAQRATLTTDIKLLLGNILPANFPLYITESGYSVLGIEPEVKMDGAVLNADVTGQFFALGGSKIFMYGVEPGYLMNESDDCKSYGNLEYFGLNDEGKIKFRTGLYYSSWLCAQKWAQPADKNLEIFNAYSNVKDVDGNEYLSAYPLLLPDGKWSVMLVNKNPNTSYNVSVEIQNQKGIHPLLLNAEVYQFSDKQYQWKADDENGYPRKSEMPESFILKGAQTVSLPAYSITVLCQN